MPACELCIIETAASPRMPGDDVARRVANLAFIGSANAVFRASYFSLVVRRASEICLCQFDCDCAARARLFETYLGLSFLANSCSFGLEF